MAGESFGEPSTPRLSEDHFRTPSSPRMWNYWMGGKDNYQVDRDAGDAFAQLYPDMFVMARQSRQFSIRVVRYLAAEAGVRQFLDIGTGLPVEPNTHEVAQVIAPDSKIVYVDNDPVVLAHARALLANTTPEGVTSYVDADVHDPERILADARTVVNFSQPVAVMFMNVLGLVADLDEARSIVAHVMAAAPAGSYLALRDGATTSEALCQAQARHIAGNPAAVPYTLRSPAQLTQLFEGLELVEPGVVSVEAWRPDPSEIGTTQPVACYGGVARKR